jgi:hypothetical protein
LKRFLIGKPGDAERRFFTGAAADARRLTPPAAPQTLRAPPLAEPGRDAEPACFDPCTTDRLAPSVGLNEAWSMWDAEIEEVIEEGRDQVLIIARVYGEGAASGIRLDEWSAVRSTFREGRILRVDGALDPDRAKALEAIGISE